VCSIKSVQFGSMSSTRIVEELLGRHSPGRRVAVLIRTRLAGAPGRARGRADAASRTRSLGRCAAVPARRAGSRASLAPRALSQKIAAAAAAARRLTNGRVGTARLLAAPDHRPLRRRTKDPLSRLTTYRPRSGVGKLRHAARQSILCGP